MTLEWRENGIPLDHPCLDGHFPGHPLVPGVVILERVLEGVARTWGEPVTIRSVKFLSPLAPEVAFTVHLERSPRGLIGFQCRNGTHLLAEGRLAPVTGGQR